MEKVWVTCIDTVKGINYVIFSRVTIVCKQGRLIRPKLPISESLTVRRVLGFESLVQGRIRKITKPLHLQSARLHITECFAMRY